MTIHLADGLEVSGHGAIIGKTGYGSTTVGVRATTVAFPVPYPAA